MKSYLKEWRQRNKDYQKNWREANKDKLKTYNNSPNNWRKKNIEKARANDRERARRSYEKHKDEQQARASAKRARKANAGGHYTAEEWKELKESYDHRCGYCNRKTKLTADHITPFTKGGTNDISNIMPACKSCNSSKGTKSLLIWLYKILSLVT